MNLLKYPRVYGTLLCADEWGNVLLGPDGRVPASGNAHYTISARAAELRTIGSKRACRFCAFLTWLARRLGSSTTDHCADAMRGVPWSITEGG